MSPYAVNTKAYYCSLLGLKHVHYSRPDITGVFFFKQKLSVCPLEQIDNGSSGKVMK